MKKEDYLAQEVARLNLLIAELVESHDAISKGNEELRKALSQQGVKDDVQAKK